MVNHVKRVYPSRIHFFKSSSSKSALDSLTTLLNQVTIAHDGYCNLHDTIVFRIELYLKLFCFPMSRLLMPFQNGCLLNFMTSTSSFKLVTLKRPYIQL